MEAERKEELGAASGSALELGWRTPPPGTSIVKYGTVQKGDWFYIQQLGAWAPVPKIGWGSKVDGALIARGQLDTSRVDAITTQALADLANMTASPNASGYATLEDAR